MSGVAADCGAKTVSLARETVSTAKLVSASELQLTNLASKRVSITVMRSSKSAEHSCLRIFKTLKKFGGQGCQNH